MLWIVFTIIAVFLFASVNILDKYVIDKLVSEPLVPVIFGSSLGLLFALLIFAFHGFGFYIGIVYAVIAVLSGGFYALMSLYYFKALCVEEISRVVPLFYLSNVIIAIFAAIYLNELLSPVKYLAITAIVTGAVLISIKDFRQPRLDKGTVFMIFAALFAATSMLLNKFVLNHSDFWTVYSLNRFGGSMLLLPIAYMNRKSVISAIRKMPKISAGIVAIEEGIGLVALVFITLATALGLVTIVTGIAAIQPLIVFILSVILSLAFPNIIKEKLDRSAIVKKLLAVVLIIVGAIFLI